MRTRRTNVPAKLEWSWVFRPLQAAQPRPISLEINRLVPWKSHGTPRKGAQYNSEISPRNPAVPGRETGISRRADIM